MRSTTMPSNPSQIIEPERFSDETLAAIINIMALRGDSPIAQMASIICNLRMTRSAIESDTSKLRRNCYVRSLCRDLYEEMVREGVIDSRSQLDWGRLRLLLHVPKLVDRTYSMNRIS